MEQSSDFIEKETDEMMNTIEVARAVDYLRAMGLTDAQICDFFKYVATGVGLIKDDDKK